MDDKIKKYTEWYIHEYRKIMNIDKIIPNISQPWLKEKINKMIVSISGIWRHEALVQLTYYLPTKKIGYICTPLTVVRKKEIKSSILGNVKKKYIQYHSIFGFVYSYYDEKMKKLSHDYCCFGYTYQSADGEYRRHFISTRQLNDNWDHYPNLVGPLEEYVIELQKRGEILIQYNPQFPKNYWSPHAEKSVKKIFDSSLDKSRLGIKLFALCFMDYIKHYHWDTIPKHISESAKQSIFGDNDKLRYEKIIEKMGGEREFLQLNSYMGSIRADLQTQRMSTECGQKLVMLKAKEAEDIENIRYNPWREFYITRQCGDLVINVISPHFPIMKDYFLVNSTSKYLFDNTVNLIKIDHSKAAEKTVRNLEKVRQETYIIDEKTKKEIYASYKFEGFSDAINIPMEYAEKNLVMSDYSLCFLNEHLGITFGNLSREIVSHEENRLKIGPVYQNFNLFSKYIFEYIYGLYCVNSVLGIIHSDLHVNNVTMFNKSILVGGLREGKIGNILYNLAGVLYWFPHTGEFSGIIDFSRGLISRENAEKNFNKRIARYIIEKEKKQILHKLESTMPEFTRDNYNDLKLLVETKFDIMFRLMTVIDMFVFTTGALYIMKNDILTNSEMMRKYADKEMIRDKAIPLLQSIHDEAYFIFTSGVRKVISGQIADVSEIEYPNLQIARKLFQKFELSRLSLTEAEIEQVKLIDYYSTENEMKYSIESYDKFPPTVKFDYIKEHDIPVDQIGMAMWEEYTKFRERVDVEEEIEEIKQKEQEKKIERRGMKTKPEKADKKIVEAEPGFSSDDTYYDT